MQCVPLLLVAALVCAGCEPPPRVLLEVVVEDDKVQVFLRPLAFDCVCSTQLVLDGTCAEVFSDGIGCDCSGKPYEALFGCITGIAVEGGSALVDTGAGVLSGSIGDEAALVVTGCDAVTRVPLRDTPVPRVRGASDFTRTGALRADVAVSVDGASHAQVCQSSGLSVECCDGPTTRVAVPPNPCGALVDVSLAAYAGPVVLEVASGPVHVWTRSTLVIPGPNAIPEPLDADSWQVDLCLGDVRPIAGEVFVIDRIAFDPTDPERFIVAGDGFELLLGPTDDEYRVTLDGNVYSAAVAHRRVERALPIGSLEPVELIVGPLDALFVNATDVADTRTLRVDFTLRVPGIARP